MADHGGPCKCRELELGGQVLDDQGEHGNDDDQDGAGDGLVLSVLFLTYCNTPARASVTPEARKGIGQVIFIDAGVPDREFLMATFPPDTAVHVLDGRGNGLEVIDRALSGRNGLGAIHIISHGGPGFIRLGEESLDTAALRQHRTTMAAIGSALSPGGDLLLYGCNVAMGKDGRKFLEYLAELTAADIAASDNKTGNPSLGGDYNLETTLGNVNTPPLRFGGNYRFILAAPSNLTTFNGKIAVFDFTTHRAANTTSATDLLGTGWDVHITGIGGGQPTTIYLNDDQGDENATLDDDHITGKDYGNDLQLMRLVSNDGSEFALQSFQTYTAPGITNISVTGYKDGGAVAGATKTFNGISGAWTTLGFTDNANFTNPGAIDEIRLTFSAPTDKCAIDDIKVVPVPTPPSVETIPTLNEWGMIIFSLLIGTCAIFSMRRDAF